MVAITLDDISNKKMLTMSMAKWLYGHRIKLQRWAQHNFSYDDRELIFKQAFTDETFTFSLYHILKQSDMTNDEKHKKITDIMLKRHGKIMMITGAKRSGKTCFGFYMCYVLKRHGNEDVYYYGPPVQLPDWMTPIMSIHDATENSTVFIDEAGIQLSNRVNTEKQQELVDVLPVVGHKAINIISVSQSTAIADINLIRMCDSIVFKSKSIFQFETERFKIHDSLDYFMPTQIDEALYFDNNHLFLIHYELPRWWREVYSTPYSRFRSEVDAYRSALMMLIQNCDTTSIQRYLKIKGTSMNVADIEVLNMYLDMYGKELIELEDDDLLDYVKEGMDDTPLQELVGE